MPKIWRSWPVFFFSSKCTLLRPHFLNLYARFARRKNTPKFLRALRAPCFYLRFARKTPFCGFRSDDTRIKKLFLLFFPPPCRCRRAQRAEKIVFAMGFFFWNGLRSKIEPLENSKFLWISKVHTFATPDLAYICPPPPKKNTAPDVILTPPFVIGIWQTRGGRHGSPLIVLNWHHCKCRDRLSTDLLSTILNTIGGKVHHEFLPALSVLLLRLSIVSSPNCAGKPCDPTNRGRGINIAVVSSPIGAFL